MTGRPISMNIVDKYIPPTFPTFMSRFTPKGRSALWLRITKMLRTFQAYYKIKFAKDVKIKIFGLSNELAGVYMKMNKALATGDYETLSNCTTDGMRIVLNAEIKKIRKIGRVEWKLKEPPKAHVVHGVVMTMQAPKGEVKDKLLTQLTSVAVFAGDKLVGGDPDNFKQETEYVVMERDLTDPESNWLVAGKIERKTVT
ncbi:39S ribosomal protein L45, mitochondrial [Irineochytrium annulatum]|nr:39S ribosomal protein L45, mitochondrial [Irineochytrium annulatum]